MRSVDSWLDRFCYKHPRLAIPNLMTVLVIGTVVVYFLDWFGPATGVRFSSYLSFAPYDILHGQVWRLITFVFIPLDDNPFFLLLSLYFYWWIGSSLEREWGSTKFTVFYGMGVLLNIIAGLLVYFPLAGMITAQTGGGVMLSGLITTTITYLNLSMFFAFATLFPDLRILLFFIIPVKVKWLAWLDAAIFAWGILGSLIQLNWVGVVIPIVAVLNYLLFFWSDLMSFTKRTVHRAKHQNSRQTVNFKTATRKAQEQKGYIHKCAVCGKTDADHPDEEFRYCSKCNGYYCYCSEHIGNHVHIE